MKKTLATLLFSVSSAACAGINLYGPGGPHTALQEAAALYTQKTGVPVTVHYGPQAKWDDEARKDADILFGASEQSALAIARDHRENFSEKNIEPLYLRKSILLVKKGNPKNIQSIEDLTRPGIGIIVNDGGVPATPPVLESGKISQAGRVMLRPYLVSGRILSFLLPTVEQHVKHWKLRQMLMSG